MARVPDANLAVVDERKITHYLLASGHPAGRAKAAFFQSFGFRAIEWQKLRDALLCHARSARVISVSETKFGTKYILQGFVGARWPQAADSGDLVRGDRRDGPEIGYGLRRARS